MYAINTENYGKQYIHLEIIFYEFYVNFISFYLVNTRMRSKRDIKMGRLCTPGVQSSELSIGVRRSVFLNGEAILDENMLFWVRLYPLVVVLKILLDFRL